MNCPSCAAPIEKDFDHCPTCETPLESAPPVSPDPPPARHPSWVVLVAMWLLFVPLLGFGMSLGSAPQTGAMAVMYLVVLLLATQRYLAARRARVAAARPRAIWSVHRDGETVVRIRDDVSQFSDSSRYRDAVTVTWHFADFDFDEDILDAFEGALLETVTPGDIAVLTVVLTREMGREWLLYAIDGKTVARRIRKLVEDEDNEVTVSYTPDAEWRGYLEVAERLGEPN